MKEIVGQKFRLRSDITGELEDTWYTVLAVEEDEDIEGLFYIYLESEYEDENIEYDEKFNIKYATITTNKENLLV